MGQLGGHTKQLDAHMGQLEAQTGHLEGDMGLKGMDQFKANWRLK